MGLFTGYVVYKIGKNKGEKKARRELSTDERDINCLNYERFCKNYGSCDGQTCEFN